MTRLHEKRVESGLNMGQLADMAQVSRPFMFDLDKGNRGARLDTWERIAAILKCKATDIIEDEQMERFVANGEIVLDPEV